MTQPRDHTAVRIQVALVRQELDAHEDRLLDLIAQSTRGRRVVISPTEACAVVGLANAK